MIYKRGVIVLLIRNKICLAVLAILILTMIVLIKLPTDEVFPISEYTIVDTANNPKYYVGGTPPFGLKTTSGNKVSVSGLHDTPYLMYGMDGEDEVMIDKEWVSDTLASVMYFPKDDILYIFGRDKPINIMFGAYATESGDPYDSPLYIGYYDGTCEYPAEFDYVRSKKKCSQYLQDTLDFVGYDTVDEMLEDAFGDYITKDDAYNEALN